MDKPENYWFNNFESLDYNEDLNKYRENWFVKKILGGELVQLDPKKMIVEGGASSGRLIRILTDAGFNAEGFEIDPRLVNYAKSLGNKLKKGDVLNPPYKKGSIDIYILNGVIEHFKDDCDRHKILANGYNILRDGGILVILVPYLNKIRRVLLPYTFIKNYLFKVLGYNFHQYIYSKYAFRSEVLNAGFSIVKECVSQSRVWFSIIAEKPTRKANAFL